MPCSCKATSTRQFQIGAAGRCKGTVTIRSECDQVDLDDEFPEDDEDGGEITVEEREGVRRGCRVTYQVLVSAGSNASAVELTVEDEEFPFPNPIAPGNNDFVYLVRPQPANCEKKKVGKVKMSCPGGNSAVIDKFEVCVLS